MTAPAVVDTCPVCAGRGLVVAERVPSGRELAAGMTDVEKHLVTCPVCCPGCDGRRSEWPRRDCQAPTAHRGATIGCDCGETVTIEDALEQPDRHRRCNEIGAASLAVVTLLCLLLGITLGLLVAVGDRVMCAAYDNTLSSCPGYGQPSTGSGP